MSGKKKILIVGANSQDSIILSKELSSEKNTIYATTRDTNLNSSRYHILFPNNNVIYVNGVKLAYIDKINQKTGQEKSNWEIKKYADGGYIKQNSWRNSGEGNLSVEETKQVAEKYAQALSTLYNQEFSVNPNVEENSFDLDIDGMAYEGGSYLIYGDGSVVNVAVNPNSRLGSTKSSINEIIDKINDLKNQYGNAQFRTLKRADGSVYGREISSEIKYADGGEIQFVRGKGKGVVKEVYFKGGFRPSFYVSYDNDEKDIKEGLKKWCKIHNYNFNDIVKVKYADGGGVDEPMIIVTPRYSLQSTHTNRLEYNELIEYLDNNAWVYEKNNWSLNDMELPIINIFINQRKEKSSTTLSDLKLWLSLKNWDYVNKYADGGELKVGDEVEFNVLPDACNFFNSACCL